MDLAIKYDPDVDVLVLKIKEGEAIIHNSCIHIVHRETRIIFFRRVSLL